MKYQIFFGGNPSDQVVLGGTEQILGPSLCVAEKIRVPPWGLHMKFDFDWPSSFRGEDL